MYTETPDDTRDDIQPDPQAGIRASRLRVPRSRGALSGLALIVLGAWTALVPFFGPSFDFAYGPDNSWQWTAARGWLEVLPGGVAFLAGLMLMLSSNRIVGIMGAWLGAAAGAWLLVGPSLAAPLNLDIGLPNPASSVGVRAAEAILFFYGVGAAIMFFGSVALGRLSVHGLRDVRAAERRAAAEEAAAREEQERIVAEHEAMLREVREREANRLQAEQDARRAQFEPTQAQEAQPSAPAGYGSVEEPGRHAADGDSPFFSDDHPVVSRGR